MGTKICTKCKKEKSTTSFPKRKKNKDGLYSWCKVCTNKIVKEHRKSNPEKVHVTDRRAWLKKTYNITPKEYDKIFESQGGRCAICRKEESLGKRLAVDHNHTTGEIRGLLCFRCNTKLAHIEDIEFVIKAKVYLNEHSTL